VQFSGHKGIIEATSKGPFPWSMTSDILEDPGQTKLHFHWSVLGCLAYLGLATRYLKFRSFIPGAYGLSFPFPGTILMSITCLQGHGTNVATASFLIWIFFFLDNHHVHEMWYVFISSILFHRTHINPGKTPQLFPFFFFLGKGGGGGGFFRLASFNKRSTYRNGFCKHILCLFPNLNRQP